MPSSMALVKRHNEDLALMPPPPLKRTKRPATVLDEDDYTDALSDIIARDFFPGLGEARAQEEYLSAIDSKNDAWIKEAAQNLRSAMRPARKTGEGRTERDGRYDTPRSWSSRTPVPDTPRGDAGKGSETPSSMTEADVSGETVKRPPLDTSALSLSSFQAKYTSEDNESFNTLLDHQNNTRRKKYAHLWTSDHIIPSQRLIAHRREQLNLLKDKAEHESLAAKHNENALVPITTGATSSRPASAQSWTQKQPKNGLMFEPDGMEDSGLQTIMEAKEAISKAGPKETVFANTRFPPLTTLQEGSDPGPIPPSPSLNTDIIAHRDALRAAKPHSQAPTEYGGETPRVNGYAFVDEDEPDPTTFPANDIQQPSYRDLLAGQIPDGTPNPFKLSEIRRREDLHHRLVAKDQARKREKERDTQPSHRGDGGGGDANMTPAARKLMEKLGRTPIASARTTEHRMSSKEMWTPGATPRRKR